MLAHEFWMAAGAILISSPRLVTSKQARREQTIAQSSFRIAPVFLPQHSQPPLLPPHHVRSTASSVIARAQCSYAYAPIPDAFPPKPSALIHTTSE